MVQIKKVLIFDSGALINLAMNGLLHILPELKKTFNGKFIITKSVKYEIIDRPINIQRFELEALRIKQLFESKIIELPDSIGIDEKTIEKSTKELMDFANHTIQSQGRWIQIVSDAEMSCLALSTECTKLGIENLIAIDERTTRLLAENPEGLEELMKKKLHLPAKLSSTNTDIFLAYRFIRSSELVYVASKKNLLQISDPKALEAALYATKFHGAAISWEEINELKKL
ncbi:MAG: hypothetical protein AABW80_02975 [Nanoarchaeota archaeon]